MMNRKVNFPKYEPALSFFWKALSNKYPMFGDILTGRFYYFVFDRNSNYCNV